MKITVPIKGSRRAFGLARTIMVAATVILSFSCAQDNVPLIERINAYRTAPQTCAGKPSAALGPLAPASMLATVDISSPQQSLDDALRRAGYSAARAQAIVISGPSTSSSAMGVLKDRYCEVLSSPQFSEIGISREGKTWRLVLAQPLIPADLGGWTDAGKQVLALVNEARGKPRSCGNQKFSAAPAVEWNAKLGSAALAHSRDMANRNYFAHAEKDGSTVGDRAAREGYEWTAIGENIAAGQGSADQVVSSWLTSPTHCVNIMKPDFTQMGAAYVVNQASDTIIYWTQVFGTPPR
ncbi:MAG TPA: CAP domain-containing protein [Burkholderiales bacterium]